LRENAQEDIPCLAMRLQVSEDIRTAFNVPDRGKTETFLRKVNEKYATCVPRLADWLAVNIPASCTIFSLLRKEERRYTLSVFIVT